MPDYKSRSTFNKLNDLTEAILSETMPPSSPTIPSNLAVGRSNKRSSHAPLPSSERRPRLTRTHATADSNAHIDIGQYIGAGDSAADSDTLDSSESLLGNTCEYLGHSDDKLRGTLNQLSPRTQKYILQAAARELMPNHRVFKCLRTPAHRASGIELRRGRDGTARFYGLQTCGSVWDCAICTAKISERRAHELNGAVNRWLADGGNLLLVTLTVSHTRHMSSKEVLDQVRLSLGDMKARRDYKAAKQRIGWMHDVTALEVTYGRNGCHAHNHMLIFCAPVGLETQKELGRIVGGAWQFAVKKNGGTVSLSVGFDIQGGDYAADYVAKWGAVREVTNAAGKKARRGGRTPRQLLEAYIFGDAGAGRQWQEYSAAFFRRKQLSWSHGAKEALGIDEESDEAIAAADDTPEFDLWATIDLLTWRCVVMARRDIRELLLRACESDDYAEFQRLLIEAVEDDRKRNGANNV